MTKTILLLLAASAISCKPNKNSEDESGLKGDALKGTTLGSVRVLKIKDQEKPCLSVQVATESGHWLLLPNGCKADFTKDQWCSDKVRFLDSDQKVCSDQAKVHHLQKEGLTLLPINESAKVNDHAGIFIRKIDDQANLNKTALYQNQNRAFLSNCPLNCQNQITQGSLFSRETFTRQAIWEPLFQANQQKPLVVGFVGPKGQLISLKSLTENKDTHLIIKEFGADATEIKRLKGVEMITYTEKGIQVGIKKESEKEGLLTFKLYIAFQGDFVVELEHAEVVYSVFPRRFPKPSQFAGHEGVFVFEPMEIPLQETLSIHWLAKSPGNLFSHHLKLAVKKKDNGDIWLQEEKDQ